MQKAKIHAGKDSLWHNFFWVRDCESDLRFVKLIWRIQDGGRKFGKLANCAKNLYTEVFCTADYKFDFWFS